jgi:hypothetical protein
MERISIPIESWSFAPSINCVLEKSTSRFGLYSTVRSTGYLISSPDDRPTVDSATFFGSDIPESLHQRGGVGYWDGQSLRSPRVVDSVPSGSIFWPVSIDRFVVVATIACAC